MDAEPPTIYLVKGLRIWQCMKIHACDHVDALTLNLRTSSMKVPCGGGEITIRVALGTVAKAIGGKASVELLDA